MDSHEVDGQIVDLLDAQLDTVMASLPDFAFRLASRIKLELRLVLRSLLWSYRWVKGVSPGQEMMQIAYRPYSSTAIAVHFIPELLLPYLLERLPQLSTTDGSIRWSRLCDRMTAVMDIVFLLHHLHFLRSGGYSTPIERAFRLSAKKTSVENSIGEVDFENQNRELLWHAFRDVLILIGPLYRRMERFSRRYRNQSNNSNIIGEQCAFCQQSPPIIATRNVNCQHIFCYYCIAQEDNCTICGKTIEMGAFLKDQLQFIS